MASQGGKVRRAVPQLYANYTIWGSGSVMNMRPLPPQFVPSKNENTYRIAQHGGVVIEITPRIVSERSLDLSNKCYYKLSLEDLGQFGLYNGHAELNFENTIQRDDGPLTKKLSVNQGDSNTYEFTISQQAPAERETKITLNASQFYIVKKLLDSAIVDGAGWNVARNPRNFAMNVHLQRPNAGYGGRSGTDDEDR